MEPCIEKQIAGGRVPGVSVLLLRHGKVVLEKAYGKADVDTGKPLSLDPSGPATAAARQRIEDVA